MKQIFFTTESELELLIENSLRKILNERQLAPSNEQEIFGIEQASIFLNLAKQTLYGFTSKKLIPFIKRGKKLYFQKSDLQNWLQDGKQLTKGEIEAGGFESLRTKKRVLDKRL